MSFFTRLEEMMEEAVRNGALPPRPVTVEGQLREPEMSLRHCLRLYCEQLMNHENSLRTSEDGYLKIRDVLVPENLDNFRKLLAHDKDLALEGWTITHDDERNLHCTKIFPSAKLFKDARELLMGMASAVGKSNELAMFNSSQAPNSDIIPIRKFQKGPTRSHTLVMPFEVMEAIWKNEGVEVPEVGAQLVRTI